ncbi:uncharacterized protein LOC115441712 [Manduca sexta]|uniref:uncharacterized protein LOC115441712 n=1 Tax=Manduca sexta TaxID=7130 RepID=UPI00188E861E|nr:uncharacterized protein LOC115441712 [Manduca sexta]XP_037298827.1 uncharacterized protein LOC115441712 [Manduca sexta]
MSDEPECQLRRRRSSANSTLPLSLDIGYQIEEGNPCEGTPSPSTLKKFPKRSSSSALLDFKNKQQSFDIQVEECEEEEIMIDSEDEEPGEDLAMGRERAVTPTPFQDFAANVIHTEGPHSTDFLRVKTLESDCYTDVSDADTDEEE